MPKHLLNKKEVADYLGIPEKEVEKLAAKGTLPAYKIGGTFLRFKFDQVAAAKNKLEDKRKPREPAKRVKAPSSREMRYNSPFMERIADFFYFNDFYIISFLLILGLVFLIVYF